MIRGLFALILCLSAGMAQALSCVPPDVVASYQKVDADSARWGAVIGRLDFDQERLPRSDTAPFGVAPRTTELRAQLVGHSLTPEGWTRPFQQNVTLRVDCFGPWCGGAVSGATYLAFVKREDGRRVVIAEPCGALMFRNPSLEDRDRLLSCFTGGACEARGLD